MKMHRTRFGEDRLPDAVPAGHPTDHFAMVPNEILRDPTISGVAKAIISLLLSNSEGWTTYVDKLQEYCKEGRDAVKKAIRELESLGYVARVSYRDVKTKRVLGSFLAYAYIRGGFSLEKHQTRLAKEGKEICTHPAIPKHPSTEIQSIEDPSTEKPSMAQPSMAIPLLRRTIYKNTNDTKRRGPPPAEESAPNKDPDPVQVVIDHWNTSAEQSGLPKVSKPTPDRKRKLQSRIKENGLKDVRLAIRAIHRSSFCRGDNDRGWRANIDFLCRPGTVAKALEGLYDDRKPAGRQNNRRIISTDHRTGVSVRADGEPVSNRLWSVVYNDGEIKVWQHDKTQELVQCECYPDPRNDGNLKPEVTRITEDEYRTIKKGNKLDMILKRNGQTTCH